MTDGQKPNGVPREDQAELEQAKQRMEITEVRVERVVRVLTVEQALTAQRIVREAGRTRR